MRYFNLEPSFKLRWCRVRHLDRARDLTYWTSWPSGLGNYLLCKRFPAQTLLWSLEFVIRTNLENDTIAESYILISQLFKTHYSKDNNLIVCFYYFTYVFRVKLHSLIVWNRRDIWWFSESNWIRTHNQFLNKDSTIQPCWPVYLCNRVMVYKLNGCGFEWHCNILFK